MAVLLVRSLPDTLSHMLPRVFFASAADDLIVVNALAELLANTAEVVAWAEDVFTLSDSVLTGFHRVLEASDTAVFVAGSPARKSATALSPNLIVEIGMSVGYLGAGRIAVLLPEESQVEIPSDLRGLTFFSFRKGGDLDSLHDRLAPLAMALRKWIKKLGRRGAKTTKGAAPSDVMPAVATKREARAHPAGKKSRGKRDSVFISYSHSDAKWLAKIRIMLTPLVRAERISVWDDTRIKPGETWRDEIEKALGSARIALLLVSPDFLASAFINDKELPPILEAAQAKGLTIVWALISACLYKKTRIAEYQAAHPIAKPLDSLSGPKRNQVLLAIAETIGSALDSSP
jgi:predicted nucleotide-binding protein